MPSSEWFLQSKSLDLYVNENLLPEGTKLKVRAALKKNASYLIRWPMASKVDADIIAVEVQTFHQYFITLASC